MNVSVEQKENLQSIIHAEMPAARVKELENSIVAAWAKEAKIPGFRPGKAPLGVVAKRYAAEVKKEVEERAVKEAFRAASEQEKLDIHSGQSVNINTKEDGGLTIAISVQTNPKVELQNYKGIELEVEHDEVTDDQVEKFLQGQRKRLAENKEVDRAATVSDIVVVDYQAQKDGAPLTEGISDADQWMVSATQQYISLEEKQQMLPGLETGLIGAKSGETRTCMVKFEETDYELLSNQEVAYVVKVHQVLEPQLPALDEAFAKLVGGPDATLEKLRQNIRDYLTQQANQLLEQNKRVKAVEALRSTLNFQVPPTALAAAAQRRVNELVNINLRQGLDEEFLQEHSQEIIEAAQSQAELDVRDEYILGEIAKQENLTVSDNELGNRLAYMAHQRRTNPTRMVKQMQKNDQIASLRYQMVLEKAVNFLVEHAKITVKARTAS
jgi:trigger factor